MPGPCSLPEGNKSRWEEMNEVVCNTHYVCKGVPSKNGQPCELLTLREWFIQRGRLTTGKTA